MPLLSTSCPRFTCIRSQKSVCTAPTQSSSTQLFCPFILCPFFLADPTGSEDLACLKYLSPEIGNRFFTPVFTLQFNFWEVPAGTWPGTEPAVKILLLKGTAISPLLFVRHLQLEVVSFLVNKQSPAKARDRFYFFFPLFLRWQKIYIYISSLSPVLCLQVNHFQFKRLWNLIWPFKQNLKMFHFIFCILAVMRGAVPCCVVSGIQGRTQL